MEIIELLHQKKCFFINDKNRYERPHKEAVKLKYLWTNEKPPCKTRDIRTARYYHKEALKYAADEVQFGRVRGLISKGLKLSPKFHALYALQGTLYMSEGKWKEAISQLENARLYAKFDSRMSLAEIEIYNKQLAECYWKRGNWYDDNGMLLEAVSEYEQTLLLSSRNVETTCVQDRLLDVLKNLRKYEAYLYHWNRFVIKAVPKRLSALLTHQAEFKISMQEPSIARHLLRDALIYDKNNEKAQELLQSVYFTGNTMIAYTMIWCMHGCYEKALVTIEKARECNPYNPGYTLLKAIVLRLSGRLEDAAKWLLSVNDRFYKLKRVKNIGGSIVANLSIHETRAQLIKQWYLIRYDLAVKYTTGGKYGDALRILGSKNSKDLSPECWMLLGDNYTLQENPNEALSKHIRSRQATKELSSTAKQLVNRDVVHRIIDMLNDLAYRAILDRRSHDAIATSNRALKIFDEERNELNRFGTRYGETLVYKGRSIFQVNKGESTKDNCRELLAESLRYTRGIEDGGLYCTLFPKTSIEGVIDRYGSKAQFPHDTKLLL